MLTTRGYFIRLVREFPSKKAKVKVKERLVNWAYEVKLCIPYPQKSHWADRPLESETFWRPAADWESPFALDNVWKIGTARHLSIHDEEDQGENWQRPDQTQKMKKSNRSTFLGPIMGNLTRSKILLKSTWDGNSVEIESLAKYWFNSILHLFVQRFNLNRVSIPCRFYFLPDFPLLAPEM